MNVGTNPSARPVKLLALAVSEWLLVLPAAALLLAAALRLVQPREYEPARSSCLQTDPFVSWSAFLPACRCLT